MDLNAGAKILRRMTCGVEEARRDAHRSLERMISQLTRRPLLTKVKDLTEKSLPAIGIPVIAVRNYDSRRSRLERRSFAKRTCRRRI